MLKIGDELEVKIIKLVNSGYGLAKLENFVIFVEHACPEDTVKVKITKISKSFAYAKILELVKASKYRVKPFCPMHNVCGSCQIQFIDYDFQLECKKNIVQETLSNVANLNIEVPKPVASPQIESFRHKVQYPITQTKNSKRILAGYYKPLSHEIVNIKYCPIQPKICDNIIEYIRQNAQNYNISGYNEKKNSGDLRHVVIRNSALNNDNLVTLVINSSKISEKFVNFAKAVYNEFEKVTGVCINFNPKKTNVILGNKTESIIGVKYIEEVIIDKNFLIGAETFFQINPKSAENIFKYVKNYISENFNLPTVLDAYAGISAFGICVADVANKVVTIEENQQSVELAQKTAFLNSVSNIEIHGGDAGEFFAKEKRKFDVIILDPPRKGCTQQSLDETYRLCGNTIIYVSCNPATLARDLKYLVQKGCKVESVKPFDMFCHTFHIENVAIIKI